MGILTRQPSTYRKKKNYEFEEVLGTGSFGEVKKAKWKGKDPPIPCAVKIIKKSKVKGHERIVYDEMGVLQHLNHPNVVKLYDWFESKTKYYMTYELANGGELFDRISRQGKLTESDAVDIIKATLNGLKYLHANGIVHRDIKPENLVFRERDSSDLLIVDFGIAKHLRDDEELLMSTAGSPGYTAPEITNQLGHNKSADLWSVGIVCYTLLCGFTPFNAQSSIREEQQQNLDFPEQYWKNVSEEAKEFIRTLLVVDPKARPTAEEALQHRWLNEHKADETTDLSVGIRDNWSAKSRWKSAYNKVIAANRFRKGSISTNASSTATSAAGTEDESDGSAEYGTADEHSGREDAVERSPRKAMARKLAEDAGGSPPTLKKADETKSLEEPMQTLRVED